MDLLISINDDLISPITKNFVNRGISHKGSKSMQYARGKKNRRARLRKNHAEICALNNMMDFYCFECKRIFTSKYIMGQPPCTRCHN